MGNLTHYLEMDFRLNQNKTNERKKRWLVLESTNASNRITLCFIIVSIEAAKLIIVEKIFGILHMLPSDMRGER